MTSAADDVVIMWFRRDLRVTDHPALIEAATRARRVVPLFVLDPALLARAGAPRTDFLHRALGALNEATDGHLVIQRGDPRSVVPALAAQLGCREVVVTRETTPSGRLRDTAVAAALQDIGCTLRGRGTPYAVDPGSVRKADGMPYAVFTPFRRAWMTHACPAPLPRPDVPWFGRPNLPGEDVGSLTLDTDHPRRQPADEEAVWAQWRHFVTTGLDLYDQQRDNPSVEGTSRLSAALHLGVVHPRQLLADLGDSVAHQTFLSELVWREFYADVLLRDPASAWNDLDRRLAAIPVDTDQAARQRFSSWCSGTTGYPMVDAGMRQLNTTGWMHNRVRMIVASFLVKDLHLPWQWGARYFLDRLVDGDVASNNHGWQWAAGTGTDAAPYFRVFNPVTQGQRYDPDGVYVRRFVPELRHVADRWVHTPWRSPLGLPDGYGPPMVDHAVERDEALARYRSVTRR